MLPPVPPRRAALAVLAAWTVLPAHAQETTTTTLAPVVVTATGFEQSVTDAPASVTVITREELQKQPFRDLTDALRYVEGVAVTGTSKEQDIFIRGLPGAYTLILVDGRRQSTRAARVNGDSGFEQSYMPPLEAIERIEVVRGPMSSLYGSDAMGGVINIITRKVAPAWQGSVGLDYTRQEHRDSGDSRQAQFYLSGPLRDKVLGLQLWGRDYRRDEDRILNGFSSADDRSLTARLAVTPNERHELLLEAGREEVRRGAAPGYSLAQTAAATASDNDRDHFAITHNGRFDWGTSWLSLSREDARRTNYTQDAQGDYVRNARAPRIENTVMDGRFTLPLGRHTLVLGGQWNRADLTDQNPGRRTGLDERFSMTQSALFVEDEWWLRDTWSLTGGLRLDHHEVYGQHWSPRLYSVWNASQRLTVKGGVSRGFKAPDIRTITPGYAYTTGGSGCTYGPNGTCGVIIGSPDLRPETSTSVELSALWTDRTLSGSATVFHTDFKDKVANALVLDENGVPARWSEDPNYRLWYSYNVDNATIRGVELSTRWTPLRALAFKAGYTYTDSEQRGGLYDGFPLARTPKHRFNLRADWTPVQGLTLWSAYIHHGKEINAGARIGTNGVALASNAREYQSYDLVDVGVAWALNPRVSLNAVLYNIGDKRLDEATYNTVGSGRRLWVGVTARF